MWMNEWMTGQIIIKKRTHALAHSRTRKVYYYYSDYFNSNTTRSRLLSYSLHNTVPYVSGLKWTFSRYGGTENRIAYWSRVWLNIYFFTTTAVAAAAALARSLFAQLTIQYIVYEAATSSPLRIFHQSQCVLCALYLILCLYRTQSSLHIHSLFLSLITHWSAEALNWARSDFIRMAYISSALLVVSPNVDVSVHICACVSSFCM